MPTRNHVLVVDADRASREVATAALLDLGYRVSTADGFVALKAFLDATPPDIVLVDAPASLDDSMTLALDIEDRGIRLVMVSGAPATMQAFRDRGNQLLHKPFEKKALARALEEALASEAFGQRSQDPV